MNIKTTFEDIEASDRKWHLVDASNLPLGRLASEIAQILRGKPKPEYAPHLDVGDHVIVINAQKIQLTANKAEQKTYYNHSGYPGGIKSKTYKEILNSKNSTLVLKDAVRRMLKGGPLSRKQLKNLYIYSNDKHPHSANNPLILDFNNK